MQNYAGIDVSLEALSVCVVDEKGGIVKEAKVASEPAALVALFGQLKIVPSRIGLEAGPLSQWLHAGLLAAGFSSVLMETRQVKDAFKSRPVKTDRKDARGIAELVRLGWYKQVHCKSLAAQEVRTLLTARSALGRKRHDLDMTLRGLLRGFGLKVGRTTKKSFATRVRELAGDNATLKIACEALLVAREALESEFARLDKHLRSLARKDERTRLVMTAPGVGPIIGLTYVNAIDDPHRFHKSRSVGAYLGLTQKKYQSGETDKTLGITKCGDHQARTALYEAANIILVKPVKAGALKSWAMKLAKRAGARRAKTALARKLGVILHRMLCDGTAFDALQGGASA